MIIRAPLKTDPPGKCSRWWVKLYNRELHKYEFHTVRGTRRDAEAYERDQKTKLSAGTFIARKDRKTLQEVYDMFLRECRARNRRATTIKGYRVSLNNYVLPRFGVRDVASLKRGELRDHLNSLRAEGKSASTVNGVVRGFKALLNFALDNRMIEANPLGRVKPFERAEGERTVNRGAFSEIEMKALLDASTPRERALIGVLSLSGVRPGEAFALDWQAVNLERGFISVRRNWDYVGGVFNAPKTKAGHRNVPLSPWLIEQLAAHRGDVAAPDALVFPSRVGTPMNPSNVRRDIWLPLKARAKVRDLDLYSLRHTFVTYALTGGTERHNVARAIGHARSTIVDKIYGDHTLDSGVAPISAAVTDRIFGAVSEGGKTPPKRPKLRVIGGGKA